MLAAVAAEEPPPPRASSEPKRPRCRFQAGMFSWKSEGPADAFAFIGILGSGEWGVGGVVASWAAEQGPRYIGGASLIAIVLWKLGGGLGNYRNGFSSAFAWTLSLSLILSLFLCLIALLGPCHLNVLRSASPASRLSA